MKLNVTKKLQVRWEVAKARFNKHEKYGEHKDNDVVGALWWDEPADVLWLYATNNAEDYSGSQTQLGVKKDGTVVWGYYSHCSCNGYSDSDCPGELTEFVNSEDTYKQYSFEGINDEVVPLLKKRLAQISKLLE